MGKNYCGVVSKSSNMKLGSNVFTTYRPVGVTCPSSCPFLNNGCYAQKYHTNLSAQHAPTDAEIFDATMTEKVLPFVRAKRPRALPKLVRFHTSGDVLLDNKVQHEYVDVLNKWIGVWKKLGVTVINYTHAWMLKGTESLKESTRASVHNIAAAKKAHSDGWYLTMAVGKKEAKKAKEDLRAIGLNGIHCPYQTNGIKCADCKLCAVAGSNKRVIIFEKH